MYISQDGVGLSELHVSASYSGHYQVTITDYKRYTNIPLIISDCNLMMAAIEGRNM
jgi:hypothetical protein